MRTEIFKSKSILLISPAFFGYEKAVKNKLIEMGARVTYLDDRPSNSLITKGLIRLDKRILQSKIDKYYENLRQQIANEHFDIIFLLNPEALPLDFLEFCKSRWASAYYVMYMWDSIKNRKHTLDFVPFCDRVFTFDRGDALLHNFLFKPLFYIDNYLALRQTEQAIQYDVCFLGTLHSDRYAIAKAVKDWCDQHQLRSYFYFFMQSRSLYYFNKLRGRGNIAPRSEVSFNKLSPSEVVAAVGAARVILDIQHPKQTGLTMRTLETVGAGKKLITTNTNIQAYDFYDEANIQIIDRADPTQHLDLGFFLENTSHISDDILNQYSIGTWLADLLQTSLAVKA